MKDKNDIRVKFEIGDIKFEAEGSADLVERERSIFYNTLLPAAIDAIVRTRGITNNTQYVGYSDSVPQDLPVLNTPVLVSVQDHNESVEDFSRISLASFVRAKGATEHYDFIICAVYYNEMKNGIHSFSSTTIKELYSDAKKPLPGNLSMSLSELVKKGLIMEDSSAKGANPKQYVLTSDGEDAVLRMQLTDSKEKKPAIRSRKQSKKSESSYSDIICDDLNLDKYPKVDSLNEFKEKMMLILYIVTNEGKGEWFTVADVVYLMTDVFGESATKNQVNGIFERNIRWFKLEKIEGNNKLVHRKLLKEGKAYAQSLCAACD